MSPAGQKDTMKLPTFEFCALRYLLLWSHKEARLHEQLAQDTPKVDGLRDALKHYGIARNFPGIDNDKTAEGVINCLLKVSSNDTQSPEQKVVKLAEQFERKFKRFNLSAASKLLWLRHRKPFPIFDSRAFRGLQKLGETELENQDKRDYEKYAKAWRIAYKRNSEAIQKAVGRLPDALPFVRDWYQSKEEIASLASQGWFQERIFDIYLWELGGNEQPVSQ